MLTKNPSSKAHATSSACDTKRTLSIVLPNTASHFARASTADGIKSQPQPTTPQTRVQMQAMPSPSRAKRYDLGEAIQKIDKMALNGYRLIGNLPPMTPPLNELVIGSYLFVKGEQFYSFRLCQLFDKQATLKVAFSQEVMCPGFKPVGNQHYIYVFMRIAPSAEGMADRFLLMLRENAHISGHSHLACGYLQTQGNFFTAETTFEQVREHLKTLGLVLNLTSQPYYLLAKDGMYMLQNGLNEDKSAGILSKKLSLPCELLERISAMLPVQGEGFDNGVTKKNLSDRLIKQINTLLDIQPIEIIGGEIYFWNHELLLINNKSGGLPTPIQQATQLIKTGIGEIFAAAFDWHVECEEVAQEVSSRKSYKKSMQHLMTSSMFSIAEQGSPDAVKSLVKNQCEDLAADKEDKLYSTEPRA